MKRTVFRHLPLLFVCGTVLVAATSCSSASGPRSTSPLAPKAAVSTDQLRMRVRSLAKPMSGIIEGAGDEILLNSATPAERITALRFKINGVPAFQGALFEPDPMAAAFDTAALLEQTRVYLDEGPGQDIPPLVLDNIHRSIADMRHKLYALTPQIATTPEAGQEFWAAAEEWGRQHPITGSFTARETAHSLFAEYLNRKPGGLFAVARRTEETAADLTWRFQLYSEYIAKQVRWQGELLLEESLLQQYPKRVLDSVGPVQVGLAELPFDMTAERAVFLAAARAERALILDFITTERLDTLDFIHFERTAVENLAQRERKMVLAALKAERIAILADLERQREAATGDLTRVVEDTLNQAQENLIDHLVLRIGQLLMVVLPVVFVAAWFLIWYAKP